MRHSHCNDMAKQTCRMRRATQSTLRTGGAQVEHPCAAAPWAGFGQAHDLKVRHCVVGSFVESGWLLFWRDRCLDCCRAVMVCLCTRAFIWPHRKKSTELRCLVTWAPFPHVSKLKNSSWNLYSVTVTIRLICGRCVVSHHIVGTTIFFFDRFRSAYLASPEWTKSFLNVPLLVHRHRITMLIFKEPGTMVSSPHIAIKHDRHYDLFKRA